MARGEVLRIAWSDFPYSALEVAALRGRGINRIQTENAILRELGDHRLE